MAIPTLKDLSDELVGRLTSTTTFSEKGFSVYDLEDLAAKGEEGIILPIAGVAYEGSEILQQEMDTNKQSRGTKSTNTLRMRFSVIIAMDYKAVGNHDSKDVAFGLLQEVRQAVHGYKAVNSRPWTLVSERPLDGDVDGVIFYGQLWMTDVFLVGNYAET